MAEKPKFVGSNSSNIVPCDVFIERRLSEMIREEDRCVMRNLVREGQIARIVARSQNIPDQPA